MFLPMLQVCNQNLIQLFIKKFVVLCYKYKIGLYNVIIDGIQSYIFFIKNKKIHKSHAKLILKMKYIRNIVVICFWNEI